MKKINHLVNSLLRKFGYQFVSTNKITYEKLIDDDKVFTDIYEACKPYTMTSKLRCYALYNAVTYSVKNNIAGDYVECGVWQGGSSMVIAHTLLSLGVSDKKIHLYDTFEGMSEPTEYDQYETKNIDTKKYWEESQKADRNEWCYSSLEEVKQNMQKTGYPSENITYTKGKVEDTLNNTVGIEKIALLRLDTDWYESTKVEMENLYPILTKLGVLILDDYGAWAGAKKAVDEYFKAYNIKPLLHRIDDTGRIMVKT